jgi:tRNA nucleotidyltransferase (CCA-adding enzyme)
MTEQILRRLRFDNRTVEIVSRLVEYHDRITPAEEKAVKRLMQRMTDQEILWLLEVQRCDRLAHAKGFDEPPASLAEIPEVMERIRASNACLSLKSLAVRGDDLLRLGIPKGKAIGDTLAYLLDAVIEGTLPNEREALLSAIQKEKFREDRH